MMVRRSIVLFALPALLAFMITARKAVAQRALGFGDDAAALPVGRMRVSLGALWDRANERYDANGNLRTLGASASASSWNGLFDARLAAASPLASVLSGLGSVDASLGTLAIGRRDASADALLGVELGVLPRLTVGARVHVASHAIEPGVALNTARVEGTMGLNPAWTNTAARDRNALLLTQFDSAIAQTARRITTCQASPSTAGCAPITANVAAAQAVVANATAFANALNSLYGGRKNAVGLPFVPVGTGAAQMAINQRVLGYRDQFAALGNSTIGTQGPAAAALFSPADLTSLLTDSLYGYRLRPLRAVHAYGVGDVNVHLKFRIYQTVGDDTASIRGFAFRQAVGASVRVSGGSLPDASEPFAPVTGSGGSGVSAQSFTDLFYGQRFSMTVVVGVAQSQAQNYAMRVPSASAPTVGGVPFPLVTADREMQLARTPGSQLDIAVTPRFALTGNMWLGASWSFSHQAADTWTTSVLDVTGSGTSSSATADAQTWAAATDWSEQRLALGGTYSTVEATREGRARLAFDVTYEHQQTLTGTGWRVSHLNRDVVTVRWYPQVWGRR